VLQVHQLQTSFLTAPNADVDAEDKPTHQIQTQQQIQIGAKKTADGNAIQKRVLQAHQLQTSFLTATNADVDAEDKPIHQIQTQQQIQIGAKKTADGNAIQKRV
jgi:uncharacterized protein (DUF736 family)